MAAAAPQLTPLSARARRQRRGDHRARHPRSATSSSSGWWRRRTPPAGGSAWRSSGSTRRADRVDEAGRGGARAVRARGESSATASPPGGARPAAHRRRARDQSTSLVKGAAAQGATVRTAGRIQRRADADAGGHFVLPTVVTGLAPDSALATDEQFGPVLADLRVRRHRRRRRRGRAPPRFGLAASVWTE